MPVEGNLNTVSIQAFTSGINFAKATIVFRLIVSANFAALLFEDFNNPFLKIIQFSVEPESDLLKLSSSEPAGTLEKYIQVRSELVVAYDCSAESSYSYSTTFLEPLSRCYSVAEKISIRINSIGQLSIQVMVPLRNGEKAFVEYSVGPLMQDSDDSV